MSVRISLTNLLMRVTNLIRWNGVYWCCSCWYVFMCFCFWVFGEVMFCMLDRMVVCYLVLLVMRFVSVLFSVVIVSTSSVVRW